MNVEKALRALRENGFEARWFATAAEAADALCAELKGKTIGIGGSVTVEQMGLGDRLSRENTVFWHWRQPAAEARKNAMAAEVYLLSANAVSETGALVNIDGTGNRVAASLYGREHGGVLRRGTERGVVEDGDIVFQAHEAVVHDARDERIVDHHAKRDEIEDQHPEKARPGEAHGVQKIPNLQIRVFPERLCARMRGLSSW